MERRLPLNEQSRGPLKVKAGVKLVSAILAASTACQESRLGTTSRKGYYAPNVRADGFGATRFRLGPLPESCIDRGVLEVFCEEKTLTKLLDRAVCCGGQDKEIVRRVANRPRAQAWRSS